MVYAFFISAGTFEDGRKLANKYMQENFEDDYEYDVSAGGTNLCNASSYTASSGKLVIPNVMDDIKCFFKVKEKEYKITSYDKLEKMKSKINFFTAMINYLNK